MGIVALFSFEGMVWQIVLYIVGLVICAIINGWLIGRISQFLEDKFVFKDAFPLRNKIN